MFLHIAWFEIRFWLRSWMLWIFFLVIAAMFFGACSSDQITIGGALSNTYRNAPFVIEQFYAIVVFFTLLMATAFVNSAAARVPGWPSTSTRGDPPRASTMMCACGGSTGAAGGGAALLTEFEAGGVAVFAACAFVISST